MSSSATLWTAMRSAAARSALLVALAGCDVVFQVPAVPLCPVSEVGPASRDDDADAFANSDDNCPLRSNANQHDENGNGVGDVCDLCPGAIVDTVDTDCDGVGDLCDAHADAADAMHFYSFADSAGVTVRGAVTIADDLAKVSGGGTIDVTEVLATDGVYELVFDVLGQVTVTTSYIEIAFAQNDLKGTTLWMTQYMDRTPRFELGTFDDSLGVPGAGRETIASQDLAPIVTGRWRMRMTIVDQHAVAQLFGPGDVQAVIEGDLAGPGSGALTLHVDDYTTDIQYFMHAGLPVAP